jgi:prephenate dehydrogenase/chorismate mutase
MHLDDLDRLRSDIAATDRELFALLRRRMELAGRIGAIKAERGIGVGVREIEEQVLARARAAAAECGISPDAMETIFRAIVLGSVERQHKARIEQRARPGGRVLIVGASGGMGRWLQGLIALAGHAVDGVDPAGGTRFARLADVRALDVYDWVVVATPLGVTKDVIVELAGGRPRAPIVEIASIKTHLGRTLARVERRGARVLCLHPMFGPQKPYWGPLIFAHAVRRAEREEREELQRLLAVPYAELVSMPFEEHDRRMGWLLGLAHLTGMVFASALARSGLDPTELEACASTTYARQKATALSILGEDPALYLDIQRLNPHRAAVHAATREALAELARLVRTGDREAFAECLARARAAVGGTSGA